MFLLEIRYEVTGDSSDGTDGVQKYFGVAMLVVALVVGPASFLLLETTAFNFYKLITFWESRLINLLVALSWEYLGFLGITNSAFYMFVVIPIFFNSTKLWLTVFEDR